MSQSLVRTDIRPKGPLPQLILSTKLEGYLPGRYSFNELGSQDGDEGLLDAKQNQTNVTPVSMTKNW